MQGKMVLILGSGVAGLSAALELAKFDVESVIVESAPFAGGHAIGFSCKALEECVRCGACLAEDRLSSAAENPKIRILTSTLLKDVNKHDTGFTASVETAPQFVDPLLCDGCGRCLVACTAPGAVARGASPYQRPPFSIDMEHCLRSSGQDCRACAEACPRDAISFDSKPEKTDLEVDAVVLASGFKAFDPADKPYGYGIFDDVITNLDLERMLRENGHALRPSTGAAPRSVAFVQCVGSRDERLGHLWCSRVCCGSALRMARLIKNQDKETEMTVFYIDIQTFGRDFPVVMREIDSDMKFIRALPGDAVLGGDATVALNFFDQDTRKPDRLEFDLVVLSVGITPGETLADTAGHLALPLSSTGFLEDPGETDIQEAEGVTAAGTVFGPMSIVESIRSAEAASWRVLKYLGVV